MAARLRTRRAQEARLATEYLSTQGSTVLNREADEVLPLGQLLCSDNRGPLAGRLLGRHPIEAVDDRNVLMIAFVACQTIESRTSIPIPEIWNELREYERNRYAQRLIGRGIEKLRPTDAAAARQVLFGIIDRATAQIALKAEAHRVRAEINDSLAADRLAFDDVRKQSACVALTWLAAGGWPLARLIAQAPPRPGTDGSFVVRFAWISCPLPVTRSNRAQRQMRRANPPMPAKSDERNRGEARRNENEAH